MRTPRQARDALLEKIRRLPLERGAEVEDFVDFLSLRHEDGKLAAAASRVSEAAFAKVWDRPGDADDDHL